MALKHKVVQPLIKTLLEEYLRRCTFYHSFRFFHWRKSNPDIDKDDLELSFNKRKAHLLRNCAIADKIAREGFPAYFSKGVKMGF